MFKNSMISAVSLDSCRQQLAGFSAVVMKFVMSPSKDYPATQNRVSRSDSEWYGDISPTILSGGATLNRRLENLHQFWKVFYKFLNHVLRRFRPFVVRQRRVLERCVHRTTSNSGHHSGL